MQRQGFGGFLVSQTAERTAERRPSICKNQTRIAAASSGGVLVLVLVVMASNSNTPPGHTQQERLGGRGGGGGGGDAKRELHSLMNDCTAMRDEARALEV